MALRGMEYVDQHRFFYARLVSSAFAIELYKMRLTYSDYVAGGQLAALSVFKQQFGVQGPDGSWYIPARVSNSSATIARV